MSNFLRTPDEWNAALAPEVPWQTAYATVERVARQHLAANPVADLVSTNTLVEILYPAQFALGAGITARKRIFKALQALADKGLSDCCTRGEPRKIGRTGRTGRPYLWHAPRDGQTRTDRDTKEACVRCPHCGEQLP